MCEQKQEHSGHEPMTSRQFRNVLIEWANSHEPGAIVRGYVLTARIADLNTGSSC